MTVAPDPQLSVVLITPCDYSTLRTTMSHLRRQTIHDQIEVLIFAPQPDLVEVDSNDADALHSVRVLQCPSRVIIETRAEGIRQARAPVVAMAEDHCFPQPLWAEAMMERHSEGYTVVGPRMINANPDTAVSWVSFLLAYGPWTGELESGEMEHLPGHNSSYQRDVVLQYGKELNKLMGAEAVMHWDLKAHGHRLFLDTRATCVHINLSQLRPALVATLHHSRVFAAVRARSWPLSKRLFYALTTPLVPLIRFKRCVAEMRRNITGNVSMPRVIAILIMALLVSAFGELLGYLTGMGASAQFDWEHEVDRDRWLAASDKTGGGVRVRTAEKSEVVDV